MHWEKALRICIPVACNICHPFLERLPCMIAGENGSILSPRYPWGWHTVSKAFQSNGLIQVDDKTRGATLYGWRHCAGEARGKLHLHK